MASDLDKARKIVAGHEYFVGRGGTHRDHIARAVAEGIALGRKEGLEMAAKLIGDGINQLAKPPSK